ncbi:PaaI family thioesterase [Algoriphagus sp. CAU 1675]|uniref:PaaI family thioesterase n=1 Tax=Algoriphagus sp. CAU 1675 TaxID=3032597 RepID=UPI0023DAF78B|nr:PaaI family thioesterase [Algoriphagus sp. CAU 1675]MDF2156398.1 PaaI family thioesterase [Algoriphagus sp. CAU 1675]
MKTTNNISPQLEFFKSQIGKKLDKTPSAAGNWLGGTLLEIDQHSIKVQFEVRPEMCNPAQILHGGVISLMLDDVIGMGNFVAGSDYLMTSINLNVDFLASAKIGEMLEVSAKLVRFGSNVNHWEAIIRKESGKIVAKASSNLIKTHVKIQDLGVQ